MAAAMLALMAITALPANNAEELIFTTPGSTMQLSNGQTTPFGFWIWCAAGAAPNSNGGYQNANACQGSMYFYALAHNAAGIIGQVGEGADGIYTATVVQGSFAQLKSNTLTPKFICQLTNTLPDGGNVNVSCQFPGFGGISGTATVTNAGVHVTGP